MLILVDLSSDMYFLGGSIIKCSPLGIHFSLTSLAQTFLCPEQLFCFSVIGQNFGYMNILKSIYSECHGRSNESAITCSYLLVMIPL